MSLELARRLLASGALPERELRAALLRHVNGGIALVSALATAGQLADAALEEAAGSTPRASTPLKLDRRLLDSLPEGLCTFALTVPLAPSGDESAITFACVDPHDRHLASELAHHVGRPVELVHASMSAVQSALRKIGRSPSQRPIASDPRGTTDRPMLLVSRTSRVSRLGKGSHPADQSGEPPERTTLLTPASVPRAPPVPTFGASRRSNGRRTRGDSGAPARTNATAPSRAPAAPFAPIEGVVDAIRLAGTRDEVIDCLLVGMSTVAGRVAVFSVKKQSFRGVACNAHFGDPARVRELEIALSPPTIFTIAVSGGAYLGPLPATAGHAPLLDLLGQCTSDVMATVIRVATRPAVVLFADELGDVALATRRGQVLSEVAGEALSRIVAGSKATTPGRP